MGNSIKPEATKIDMSNKGIKDLGEVKSVDKITEIVALERIDLSKNKLTYIPHSVTLLFQNAPNIINSVTSLSLRKNRFAEFPKALFVLLHLKVLDMAANELKSVPDDLTDFWRLEELVLEDNQIEKLPWRINRWKRLRILNVMRNQLKFLPTLITDMDALEIFEFSENPLDAETYGRPRVADELLQIVSKQKMPPIYTSEEKSQEAKESTGKTNATRNLLKNTLTVKEGIAAMQAYTKKQHNAENLNFYLLVNKFRQKYNSRKAIYHPDLVADAFAIYDRFVKDEGPEQLNLPGDAMSKLQLRFRANSDGAQRLDQWVFDDAFEAALALLETDIFARFRVDSEYKSLVSKVELYTKKKQEKKRAAYRRQAASADSKPVRTRPRNGTDASLDLSASESGKGGQKLPLPGGKNTPVGSPSIDKRGKGARAGEPTISESDGDRT